MRSRLVLAAKTLVGVLIALDWWYFVSVEVASSPLNTYNTVGFLPRVVVSLAYLAWLLWPLRRVGWSQPRVDIEPDTPRDIRGRDDRAPRRRLLWGGDRGGSLRVD